MVWHQMTFDDFYSFIAAQSSKYSSQTSPILIIDDFSSILRCEHKVIEHIHFVCDKLCAFCASFCSFRFTIGLNTFIVSCLEIFCITFNAHPHSGWFICLAPTERDRLKSLIKSHAANAAIIYYVLNCNLRQGLL